MGSVLLAFYFGGVIAGLPLGANVRVEGRPAVWPLLLHTLGWPLIFVAMAAGVLQIGGTAEVERD